MILRQTAAIFHDAYRELNAKKLFWITLAITLLIVIAFALVGIDSNGVHFITWTFPGSAEYASRIEPALFYKAWMYDLGIDIWLGWASIVLALISTAGIFPDLLSSGAIDLQLSKPISRLRLFLTKFATGLLFVAVQLSVFAVGCMLVIGFRAGAWEWSLLLAIPIVLAFFSYLYAICTLFGVLTRSTITSLLLTLIAWLLLFSINALDAGYIAYRSTAQVEIEEASIRIDSNEKRIASLERRIEEGDANDRTESSIQEHRKTVESSREDIEQHEKVLRFLEPWHDWIYRVKTVLPKTGETVNLLDRYVFNLEELEAIMPNQSIQDPNVDPTELGYAAPGEARSVSEIMPVEMRIMLEFRNRSLAWVLGTSFAFSAGVLGLAAFIFCRRDF